MARQVTDDERAVVQQALRQAGIPEEVLKEFEAYDLDCLFRGGYKSAIKLKFAKRQDLLECGLQHASVGLLLDVLGGAGEGADTAAVKGLGPQNIQELTTRLNQVVMEVNERVVRDLITYCAPQLPYADDRLLVKLYNSVKAAPHTSTKVNLKRRENLVFNGSYSSGTPARATLLVAFKEHTQPLLAKFTVDAEAIEHEHQVLSFLLQDPPASGIVGPVQLVQCDPDESIQAGSGIMHVKRALLMPLYPATLQHVPKPMDPAAALKCGQQLKSTLDSIHKKGYGHNDVKAPNVFLDIEGNCVLGDFGAAQKLNAEPKECTNTHWPAKLDVGGDTSKTSVAVDYFLLAVTLLERAGVHELVTDTTTAMLREAADKLVKPESELLLRGFVLNLLDPK